MIRKTQLNSAYIFLSLFLAIISGCDSKKNSPYRSKNEASTLSSTKQCAIDTRNTANNFQAQYLKYQAVRKHKTQPAFTQGLQYHEGVLYESSGLRGKSFIARRQLQSTKPESGYDKKIDLAPEYFAEGLSLHKGRLYQLTWTSGEAFIYKPEDLSFIEKLKIDGEGWGISSNGTHIYTSDGSATIAVRNEKLEKIDSIKVHIGTRPLKNLNELEWINGCLFANIWRSTVIVVINPIDGAVTAMIDGAPLLKEQQTIYRANSESRPPLDVLNGIAFRDKTRNLLVTGKNWSTLYELEVDSLRN